MFNPLGFDKDISNFHSAVDKLYNEQPKNILAFIYRRITAWVTGSPNQKLNQDISNIAAQAEKMLGALPKVISRDVLNQFYNDMDRLFKEIYPLAEMNPFSTTNKMPKLVQEYFSSDIKTLRREKRMDPAKVQDDEHRLKRKIAKGKLAIALGRGVKKNSGSSGALIILDINEKPVGIHKVSKQVVSFKTRIMNFIKVLIGGQLSCLSNSDFAQPMAEKASYILSKELGFNLAPPSKIESFKGLVGVFQIFISKEKDRGVLEEVKVAQNIVVKHAEAYPPIKGPNDYREAKEILSQIDTKDAFTTREQTLFQKLALFDYLIGNLDRHEENWLVTFSPQNEITHIKAIDNANAFPKIQPEKGTTASKYQYHWKSLKISKQQFTPEVVGFVKDMITFNNLHKVVDEIQKDCDGFLDENMKQLLYVRQKVVYKLVCEDKGKTPSDLASYSTEDEMLAYCRPKITF